MRNIEYKQNDQKSSSHGQQLQAATTGRPRVQTRSITAHPAPNSGQLLVTFALLSHEANGHVGKKLGFFPFKFLSF